MWGWPVSVRCVGRWDWGLSRLLLPVPTDNDNIQTCSQQHMFSTSLWPTAAHIPATSHQSNSHHQPNLHSRTWHRCPSQPFTAAFMATATPNSNHTQLPWMPNIPPSLTSSGRLRDASGHDVWLECLVMRHMGWTLGRRRLYSLQSHSGSWFLHQLVLSSSLFSIYTAVVTVEWIYYGLQIIYKMSENVWIRWGCLAPGSAAWWS